MTRFTAFLALSMAVVAIGATASSAAPTTSATKKAHAVAKKHSAAKKASHSARAKTEGDGAVSAMSDLPALSNVPPAVEQAVERDAESIVPNAGVNAAGNPQTALSTLRLLDSNLGDNSSSLYAFEPTSSPTYLCLQLWIGQTSDTGCGDDNQSSPDDPPGISWTYSPGGQGYVGVTDSVAPALWGWATDDIDKITIDWAGTVLTPTIKNNSFFAQLTTPPTGTKRQLQITVHYDDGSTASTPVMTLASGSDISAKIKADNASG